MDPDDMDIEDIDDELNLPGDLVNLSVAAKKELLAYKSTHNERDWEEEILRRIESLGKNKDYLALKRLQDKAEGGAAAVTATPGGKRARSTAAAEGSARKKGRAAAKKGGDVASDSDGDADFGAAPGKRKTAAPKASAAATAKGRKAAAAAKLAELSEEEDDFEDDGDDSSAMRDDDDEEEDDDLGGDDDDDDDLFDSDEEEEATNAVRRGASLTGNLVKGGTAAAAEKKAKAAKASRAAKAAEKEAAGPGGRRKRLSKYDDSSEDDAEDDGDEDEDEEGDDSGAEGRRRGRYGLGGKRRGRGDSSGESDDEGGRRRAADAVDTSGPASVEDIQRVQLRRAFVEKWILEPYFEKVVRKQFARVYVGQSTAHNTPLYRMCEVQGIVPYRKSYKLVAGDAATGKPPIVTDRAMLVSIGPSKITMKLDAISNSRITEAELAKYVQTLAKLKPPMELITKDEAHRRREAVTRALNHRYTNEEIQELVQKRMGHSDYVTTEFSTAKERLLNKLDVARSKHDEETALRIERELAKLEAGYEQQKERFQASKAMHFHSLNMRNREANAQSDIQASLKRDVRNDATMDPFRRRETLPSIIWNTSGKLHEVVTDMSKGKDKDKDKNKDKESEAAADKDTAAEEVDPKARKAEAEAKYYALTRAISDGSAASSSASSSAPTVGAVVSTSRAMAAASQGGAGHFLQKQYELQAAASTQFNFFHDLSLDQIRERVRGRLGLEVDPIEATTAKTAAAPADGEESTSNPIRDKYLAARCGHLPPVDSEERELLRRGLKLSTVKIKENRVTAAAHAGGMQQ